MSHLFISHATADDATVDRIHDALTAAGIETWVDHKRLKPGDDWEMGIQQGLDTCDAGLFVLSPKSFNRVECRNEIRTLLDYQRRFYVALVEAVTPQQFPYRLRTTQYANLARDWTGGTKALIEAMTGKRDLDEDAPAVEIALRITGRIDLNLTLIPMSGRDEDLRNIKQRLMSQPVAILGVGGLGKSRLAAEAAQTSDTVQNVIWHVASEFSRADDVLELVRDHFELPNTTEAREALKKLRETPTLVVIDNAESVEAGERRRGYVNLIRDLVAEKAQVLLTARAEWQELPAGVFPYSPQQLEPEAARQIVLDMAQALGAPDLTAHAEALAKAARQHPRLIEWAVRKTTKFPAARVIQELKELKSAAIQDALEEMILRTVAQMGEAEGSEAPDALKRLNVCRGGLTYEAAKALLEADEDTVDARLGALQAWQFVSLRGARYEIDPLVIAAVGEAESARRAHYDFYYALARQHDGNQDYYGLDVESDNLDAAFEWAMENDAEDALWLANTCGDFLANRGRFTQRVNWSERVVMALAEGENEALRANAQNSLGTAYRALAALEARETNLKRAVAAYEQALRYYSPQTAPLAYAMTQNNLGNAYSDLAALEARDTNLKRAVAAYEQALLYRTPQSAPLAYAMTQNNLGNAYSDLAALEARETNLKRAVAAYEQALLYRTPQSAPLDYAMTQNNLGNAYRDLAALEARDTNLKRAVAAYEQALRYRTPQSAPLDYAMTQANLGITYEDLGDLRAAIACWREAEMYYRRMGDVENADRMLGWIEEVEGKL